MRNLNSIARLFGLRSLHDKGHPRFLAGYTAGLNDGNLNWRDKFARLEDTNKRNFELAQKNIKEVARLQAYLEQTATEVATEIGKIRAADKTVEQRMRAEKAERALKDIASYPSHSMHDAFDNSNRMVQIALDTLAPTPAPRASP